MCQSRPLLFIFVLFTFQFKWQIYNWKKSRWCAWDSNPGIRMEGADESTELWRHPQNLYILYRSGSWSQIAFQLSWIGKIWTTASIHSSPFFANHPFMQKWRIDKIKNVCTYANAWLVTEYPNGLCSVTRFGLFCKISSFWQIFVGSFSIWQIFKLVLAISPCCKLPNIEKIILSLSHTGSKIHFKGLLFFFNVSRLFLSKAITSAS